MSNDRIEQSERCINWLDEQIGDRSFPAEFRTKVAVTCIEIARRHHRAIVFLVAQGLHGSAAALLRVLWESYIKSVWLFRCANGNSFKHLKKDRLDVPFAQMVTDIEALSDFDCGVLSLMKQKNWNGFCSYTHTGILAIDRHLNGSTIESNFSSEELCEMLGFADAIGQLAALQLAQLCDDTDLAHALIARAKLEHSPAQRE